MSASVESEREFIARAKERAARVSQRCSEPPGPSVIVLPVPPSSVRTTQTPTITQRARG
jgi:hypothetical protein